MSVSLFSMLLFPFQHFTFSSWFFFRLCWTHRSHLYSLSTNPAHYQSVILFFSLISIKRSVLHLSKISFYTGILDVTPFLFCKDFSSSINPSLYCIIWLYYYFIITHNSQTYLYVTHLSNKGRHKAPKKKKKSLINIPFLQYSPFFLLFFLGGFLISLFFLIPNFFIL